MRWRHGCSPIRHRPAPAAFASLRLVRCQVSGAAATREAGLVPCALPYPGAFGRRLCGWLVAALPKAEAGAPFECAPTVTQEISHMQCRLGATARRIGRCSNRGYPVCARTGARCHHAGPQARRPFPLRRADHLGNYHREPVSRRNGRRTRGGLREARSPAPHRAGGFPEVPISGHGQTHAAGRAESRYRRHRQRSHRGCGNPLRPDDCMDRRHPYPRTP